jgi:hypothetical protein
MMNSQPGHCVLGQFDQTPIEDSYDRLPLDEHTTGEFRFRRMSKIVVNGDNLFFNESTFIQQPASVNSFLSDRVRIYEKIEDSVFYHPTFRSMVETFQSLTGWDQSFELHQIRIVGHAGVYTHPAPEGPHRDGYEFIMPFVHKKVNLEGGITTIRKNQSDSSIILTADLSQQFILIKDREVLHYATPFTLIDPEKEGHWDTFVFAANID